MISEMSKAGTIAPFTLERAAQAALDFLLKAQDESGAWKDFLLPAGNSNVWVTAFVAGILAPRPEPEAQRAAKAGWIFLKSAAKPNGGWSYNASVPGDADSTLWGLRLCEVMGRDDCLHAIKADEFLELHLRNDGGLATYATAEPIRRYIGVPAVVPFGGWTSSHVCVTAAGANLTRWRGRLIPFLMHSQRPDGSWPAYWWFDDEFSTAEAVAALAGDDQDTSSSDLKAAAIERAVDWALTRVSMLCESSWTASRTFALAHALRILMRRCDAGKVKKGLSQGLAILVEHQQEDGSWSSAARLRVPRPDVKTPNPESRWKMWQGMPAGEPSLESILLNTFTNYSPDHYRVYTTATVLRAFQEAEGS